MEEGDLEMGGLIFNGEVRGVYMECGEGFWFCWVLGKTGVKIRPF